MQHDCWNMCKYSIQRGRILLVAYCAVALCVLGCRVGWAISQSAILPGLLTTERRSADSSPSRAKRRLRAEPSPGPADRILYIVTSANEFDTGRRETVRGHDRFSNTIVPIVQEATASMSRAGYQVDVYLIAHYPLSAERIQELAAVLPATSALDVWPDATPLGYPSEHGKRQDRVAPVTRGLARQHRYVVKDKLMDSNNNNTHYSIFVCFEDDMLVRGAHVRHYANVTDQLFALEQRAGQQQQQHQRRRIDPRQYHGPMTSRQLSLTIPGFMRVEAALLGFERQTENLFEQIPVDYQWSSSATTTTTARNRSIDPTVCCHVSAPLANNDHIPAAPDKDELYFWETSIDALGVRQMPPESDLGWVLLLGGSNNENFIGDWWSGRGKKTAYFGQEPRPDRKRGRYLSNQGGWMGTRRQILRWHNEFCKDGFLP